MSELLAALLDEARRLDSSQVYAHSGRQPQFSRGISLINSPSFPEPLTIEELNEAAEALAGGTRRGWRMDDVIEWVGQSYRVSYTYYGPRSTLSIYRRPKIIGYRGERG